MVNESVHDGDYEAVEERGSDETAEDDLGHRTLDLVAGEVASYGEGDEGEG